MSAEKPSELGTGEGTGESLELTLCPSEPELSFTSFTLKSMQQKRFFFWVPENVFSNLVTFDDYSFVQFMRFKEDHTPDSELEKLSL